MELQLRVDAIKRERREAVRRPGSRPSTPRGCTSTSAARASPPAADAVAAPEALPPDAVGSWHKWQVGNQPFRFGFESEASRRREQAERGAGSLGGAYKEADFVLRPGVNYEHALNWQPATRQQGWGSVALRENPFSLQGEPVAKPIAPDAAARPSRPSTPSARWRGAGRLGGGSRSTARGSA